MDGRRHRQESSQGHSAAATFKQHGHGGTPSPFDPNCIARMISPSFIVRRIVKRDRLCAVSGGGQALRMTSAEFTAFAAAPLLAVAPC